MGEFLGFIERFQFSDPASVLGRPCVPGLIRGPVSAQVLTDVVALLPVCAEHAGIEVNIVGEGPSRSY